MCIVCCVFFLLQPAVGGSLQHGRRQAIARVVLAAATARCRALARGAPVLRGPWPCREDNHVEAGGSHTKDMREEA